jgi:hypothetical protein
MPWASGLVLLAGIVAVLVTVVPNSNPKRDLSKTENPVVVSRKAPNKVPLAREARLVAGKFILTAVQREGLAEAWKISGPQIRQDLTYQEWLTGNIPVVPYPAKIKVTPMKVDYSFKNHALLEVALIPVKAAEAKIEYFWLELKRVNAGQTSRWLVWSWVPRYAPPIPANPVG